MAGGIVGRLRAFLGLDTANFTAGVRRSEKDVQRMSGTIRTSLTGATAAATGFSTTFARGLAGGVVGAAFAGISANIADTIRGIAEIGDQAKRSGMDVMAFQQWGYVAQQNRIDIDAMTDGFKELQLRADEFIMTGGGGGADSFRRLGLSADDLAHRLKDPSELMLELIRRAEGLDKAAQIRIFDEALGGAGGERFVELLSLGEGELRKALQRAKDLGIVLDEGAIESAAELNRQFSDIQAKVSKFLRNEIVQFGQDIVRLKDDLQPIVDLAVRLSTVDLSDIFGSEDAARGILGGDLFGQITWLENLSDAQIATLRDLSGAYARLADDARRFTTDIASAASTAGSLDYDDLQDSLINIRTSVMELTDEYDAGEISGEQFASRMTDLQQQAADAFDQLDAIGRARFGESISNLSGLGRAIDAVRKVASALRAELIPPAEEAPREMFGPPKPVWINPDVNLPERARRAPDRMSFETSENAAYGYEKPSTGKGGGGAEKRDDYKAAIAAIREETSALEAEAEALLAVSVAGQGYADVIEYARRRAELMHAAQKDGLEITPALRQEIDQLARAYSTAGMNAEDAADRLRKIEEAGSRGAEAITDIFLSLRNGTSGLKDALANLLLQLAQIQMQKAVLSTIGGGSGGFTRWLGGMLQLPGNAGGTQNWRGGLTRVNELGGEIMDLPSGTRIIPHDISKRIADGANHAQGTAGNLTVGIGFDRSVGGFTALIRDEAGNVLAQAAPGIVRDSVQSTDRAMRKNGRFGGMKGA